MMTEFSRSRIGFTLPEMLVATVLSTFVLAGLIAGFVNVRKSLWIQHQLNDLEQNMRVGINMLSADTRMAGYGVPVEDNELASWIDWVPGLTSTLHVARGAAPGDPDTLHITGALEPCELKVLFATDPGDTRVDLSGDVKKELNLHTKKLIFVGHQEMARVTSISGKQITFSKDPVKDGYGLEYEYPPGTPVEVINVISYSCVQNATNFPFRPYLRRDDNTGDMEEEVQKVTAVGIEDLQVSQESNRVAISITGRTESDYTYEHPVRRDGHRRTTVQSAATPRNRI